MAPILGPTVQSLKHSYRSYKQQKMEKEERQLGNPIPILDPSHELEASALAPTSVSTSRSSLVEMDASSLSLSLSPLQQSGDESTHSSADRSICSPSYVHGIGIDIDMDMDMDGGFARFMQWQRRWYTRIQRMRRDLGMLAPPSQITVHANPYPQPTPPSYESVIARGVNSSRRRRSSGTSDATSSSGEHGRTTHEMDGSELRSSIGDVGALGLYRASGVAELDAIGTGMCKVPVLADDYGSSERPNHLLTCEHGCIAELPATAM